MILAIGPGARIWRFKTVDAALLHPKVSGLTHVAAGPRSLRDIPEEVWRAVEMVPPSDDKASLMDAWERLLLQCTYPPDTEPPEKAGRGMPSWRKQYGESAIISYGTAPDGTRYSATLSPFGPGSTKQMIWELLHEGMTVGAAKAKGIPGSRLSRMASQGYVVITES